MVPPPSQGSEPPPAFDDADASPAPPHRAGFVALCGRPNVGKSTLLNALLGESLAVVCPKPQTTRERLLGIWSGPGFQAVLVDTPGFHRARSALNRYMVAEALAGARDVDLVLLLAEVPRLETAEQVEAWQPGEVALEALQALKALGRPILLVLTKADHIRDRDLMLPVIDAWAKRHPFEGIVPVSAVRGRGLDTLRAEVVARLPRSPPYYDPEDLSDRSLQWHAAELVRAELFDQLQQELPYSCAVLVDSFREGKRRDRIHATVHVERNSQKGMVIGKGARRIRSVSRAARRRIEALTGKPCDLFVQVRVTADWTKDPDKLATVGYTEGDQPE